MKKLFILAASAAVVLAACAKVETFQNTSEENAISFGTYVPRTVTKAGSTDALADISALQTAGFGVFASYTDNADFSSSSSKMNFMWNQQVTYSTSWSYSPVKYWPNEHGTTAESTGTDKLSFFAYAPYVASTNASNGTVSDNTWGITDFTSNETTGDPKVSYTCDATHPVDLVWGVINTSVTWAGSNNVDQTLTAGGPYINLVKPKGTPAINFLFKHALAQLVVNVKAVEDGEGTSNIAADDVDSKAAGTRIYIKNITLTGTNVYNSGKLNLNNTTRGEAKWEVTGTAETTFVNDITSSPLYLADTPSTWDDINWKKATKPGVITDTYTELYRGMAIPASTKTDVDPEVANAVSLTSVTIDYFVITKDENLQGNLSVIENVITKSVGTPIALTSSNRYALNLDLGMKTVDISATVEAWTENSETLDLPQNQEGAAASGGEGEGEGTGTGA